MFSTPYSCHLRGYCNRVLYALVQSRWYSARYLPHLRLKILLYLYCWYNYLKVKKSTVVPNFVLSSPRVQNCPLFFFFFKIYFSTSLSFAGNSSRLTWVRHSSSKSSATHSYQGVQCFFCASRRWYIAASVGDLYHVHKC